MPGGCRDIGWLHCIPGHLGAGRGPGGSTTGRAQSPWGQCCWGAWGQCTPPQHRAPSPDLHVLLLEDLLVLLQKQDEKLLLKCHSKTAVGSADSKQTFSPVLKLNAVLIRSVATGARRAVPTGLGGTPSPRSTRVSPPSPAPSKCGGPDDDRQPGADTATAAPWWARVGTVGMGRGERDGFPRHVTGRGLEPTEPGHHSPGLAVLGCARGGTLPALGGSAGTVDMRSVINPKLHTRGPLLLGPQEDGRGP